MFLVFTFSQLQQIMIKNPPEAQMYVTRIDSLTGSFLIIAWCLMFVFIYFYQKKKTSKTLMEVGFIIPLFYKF